MYTLNFTRLFGLVFIFSRLILVIKADNELPTCYVSDDDSSPEKGEGAVSCMSTASTAIANGNFCIYGSKIYKSIVNSTNDPVTGSKCEEVKENSDDKYIIFTCTDSACVEATDFTGGLIIYEYVENKWTPYTSKYYYNEINNTSLLYTCPSTAGECTAVETDGYYLLTSSNSNQDNPTLIKVAGTGSEKVCTTATDGYYLLTSSNSNQSASTLIKVAAGTGSEKICTVIETDGYYLITDSSNSSQNTPILIKVDNKTPTDETSSITEGTSYYFDQENIVNGSESTYSKLIKCTKSGDAAASCGTISKTDNTLSDGIYINAAKTELADSLINCVENEDKSITCSLKTDPKKDDIYVSADKKLIKCDANGCDEKTTEADVKTTGYYLDYYTKTTVESVDIFTQLISCSETTNCVSEAISIESSANDDPLNAIYINAAKTKLADSLIDCVKNDDKSITCSLKADATIGYYLDYSSKDETDSKFSKIITCTETKCDSDAVSTAGIYINAAKNDIDDSLISCKDNKCSLLKADNEQYYINTDSKLIECTKNNTYSLCDIVPSTDISIGDSTFLDQGKYDEKYTQIITCTKASEEAVATCGSTAGKANGYYNNGAVKEGLAGALITCTADNNCDKGDAKEGYYEHGSDKAVVIKCSKEKGCFTIGGDENDVYLDALEKKNIILCSAVEEGATAGTISCKSTPKTSGYYFNAGDKKSVIGCTETSCLIEDRTLKGYFINSAGQNVIKCTGDETTPCEILKTNPDDAFNGVGTIKVTSAGSENLTVELCIANDCGESDVVKIGDSSATADVYKSLTVDAGKFPGVDAGVITVKISKDGYALLMEDGGLPECGEIIEGGRYCIEENKFKSTDPNIKEAIAGTCSERTIEAGKTYYFTSDYKEINITNEGAPTPAFAYYCKTTDSCTLVKGTVKDSNNYVQCSGWKKDDCIKVTPSECAEGDIGKLGTLESKNAICFGTKGVALPETSSNTPTTYALVYFSEEVAPALGLGTSKVYAISLTEKAILVTTDEEAVAEAGYQLNSSVYGVLEKAIIHCTEKENIESCTAIDANPGYYVNEGGDKETNPLIKCTDSTDNTDVKGTRGDEVGTESTGCVADAGALGYFVEGAGMSQDGTYFSLISCEEVKADTSRRGVTHPRGEGEENLTNKETTSGSSDPITCSLKSPIIGFYLSGIAEASKNALIECSSPTSCQVKSIGEENNDGTYSLEEGKSFLFINNNKNTTLILCETDKCEKIESSAEKGKDAYYINGGKTGALPTGDNTNAALASDDYSDLIIRCTFTDGCILIDAGEYYVYLNGYQPTGAATKREDEISSTGKELIICSKGKCEEKPKSDRDLPSNYYVNAGIDPEATDKTKQALISCGESGCVPIDAEIGEGVTEKNGEGVTENFYINANADTQNTNKSDGETRYVIQCTKGGCTPFKSSNKDVTEEYYVHGKPGEELADALITCVVEEVPTKKRQTTGTEDAQETTKSCELLIGIENNIYINYDQQKIIRCSDTSCATDENNSTDKNSTYYINSVEGTSGEGEGSTRLIKCVKDGCEIVTAFDISESSYKVYLNANYQLDKWDKQNALIKCSPSTEGEDASKKERKDTTANLVCELAGVEVEEDVPQFFVNADKNKDDEDYDGPLKNDIIKCENDSDGVKCRPQNAKNKDVYINSNYGTSENDNQIIKCDDEKGCVEAPAYPVEEIEEEKITKRDDTVTLEDAADSSTNTNSDNLIYYVNAGHVKKELLEDTLIECTSEEEPCTILPAEAGQIYINALDSQLIQCSSKGCEAKTSKATEKNNEFYINSSDVKNARDLNKDLIKCTLDKKTKEKKCEPFDGKDKAVYVNGFNTSEVIYCLQDKGCDIKASNATELRPEYYVNGDDIDFIVKRELVDEPADELVDEYPLVGDLVECKMSKAGVKCAVINGKDGNVYINSNYDKEGAKGDNENQIIECTPAGCTIVKISDEDNVDGTELKELPQYFINSGASSGRHSKFEDALIRCAASAEECEIIDANAFEVYINSNGNQKDKPLIKCNKNSCDTVASSVTEGNVEHYINAGKVSEEPLDYAIISCSVDETEKEVACQCLKGENIKSEAVVYLNTNYAENGDNNQLIQCSKDNGCAGIKSQSTSKVVEYYVNGESNSLANAIIYCSNKRCEKQTPESSPVYYVGKDNDNEVDGLIECKEVEEEEEEVSVVEGEEKSEAIPGRKRATVVKCALKSAFTSEGYYLNSGDNKAKNQTIICDSFEGCSTLKVDLGYYVNAGNPDKQAIICEKEGMECVEEEISGCQLTNEVAPGTVCYEDSQLKFFASSNSTAIAATQYEDIYSFATVPANVFPGITKETGSFFKISNYYINRFYKSGVVMIDKNGRLVDDLNSVDQSEITVYDCDDSTKTCRERPGCTPNTYMFDSENGKAIFCNNGKMEYAKFNGYVVDSTRVSGGSKHPYLIFCEAQGERCRSFKPKIDAYYENSAYDSETNALIECSKNNCLSVTAEVGYYVGHGDFGPTGIIKCASANSCSFSYARGNFKYVNAGSDKKTKALINCNRIRGCSTVTAKIGNYITHSSALLIECKSPSSCAEFTPTVNYYDNADSSESSNTIINCVQNSNTVSCGLEVTNNGFYMSSVSNVLIRCKAGKKCKTVTVKSGLFRGALKGLTSSEKRSFDEDVEKDLDSEVNDEKKKMTARGDSEDGYGIIRCSAGKCTALSPSELAAIPMCEFNNNKCYITPEYAMTKSATTSITAGNICTNEDRSVFYFATDTVVVKPNVISGVISTYVYTTTKSNCLEVNDSYDDMYFTVGPNIYLLDQGSVLQFYDTGYYFINVEKNELVKGNKIDAYNNENVKLYSCDGSTCNIMNKPESVTYFADANKRILKYDVRNDVYSFAYEKDITCYFVNNKCTPNADLNAREFCITYKGEIVLATTDIKNRETGECYRASSMNSNIYGFSQSLYSMNLYSAQMVDQTGYYIISRSTNSTVVSKNYKAKNNNLVVYGCTLSQCKVVEPDEDIYYYDPEAKTILRYKDGTWSTPSASGYAYISINPTDTYVYKFSKKGEEITVQSKADYGYYYTVDNEMYHCEQDGSNYCTPISDTGYYFTNVGEVYYCIHDSEELEATECTKKACVSGQYYYINDAYYRCEVSSLLTPVVSRYCSHDDNVIINFPLALNEELPQNIQQAVDGVEKNNNSTAIVRPRGRNLLSSVSGVFTNCTYNVEDTKSTFDLVCVNNFVTVDKEFDEVKICSVEQLGYVECIEDENNPEKCNVSAAYAIMKPSMLVVFIALILTALYHLY